MLSPTELYTLGLTIKRRTTNGELLSYLDETLALLKIGREHCPVCTKRRRAKAEAMKRYRNKQNRNRRGGDFDD